MLCLAVACGGSPVAKPVPPPAAVKSAEPERTAKASSPEEVRYDCDTALKHDIRVRRVRGIRRLQGLDAGERFQNLGCQELDRTLRNELYEYADARLDIASADYIEQRCKDYKPPPPRLVRIEDSGQISSGVPHRPQSDTNQQVSGVDEPDLIEVDGNRFYAISGDRIVIFDTTDPGKPRELGSLHVEGAARGLFADGPHLVVLSSLGAPNPKRNCGLQCWERGERSPGRLTVFDVSDPRAPVSLRELEVSGYWLGARKIGSSVHVVTHDEWNARPELNLELDHVPANPAAAWAAFEEKRRANRKALEPFDLSTPLPRAAETVPGLPRAITECNASLTAGEGGGFTSILSFDLADRRPARRTLVRGWPGPFYATDRRLYLTTPRGGDTRVHQLSLEGASSRHVASGMVQARIPSQFALDEHESFLRVVTTEGTLSSLQVLHAQGSDLRRVGSVSFGPREETRAVRFAGDRGYAVTFPGVGRRVDPLFAFDLSDPERPRVLGELEVPGFSTYVHPLDEGHLLTIGYDADRRSGAVRGMVIQVFDVTRPSHPRTVDRRLIGSAGTSSAALTNHLAFTYFSPKNLLLLPLTVCERRKTAAEATFSGLMMFGVGSAGHLSQRGRVSHGDLTERNCNLFWTQGESAVERTALLGDFVYAVGDRTLSVVDLRAPYRARSTLPLR